MEKDKPCFMSIDLSTTACKVLIFDSSGIPIAESHCDMPLFHPRPNWIEADANDWWNITVKCIRQVLDNIPSYQIAGIGVCGLMHALVPVDRSGVPLDRVMLWMDQRCKPQCEWIKERRPDHFIPTYLSAPKLRWLIENKPDVVDKTYKFMFGKDFIRLKLTGEFATDESDAGGTALFDYKQKCWSDEMLNLIGIPIDKMLSIKGSTEIAGYVTESSAKETGLKEGTPVVIGASDVKSTFIGVNIYTPKRVCLYMGTAAWVAISDEKGAVNWGGATATFGVGLRWCNELFDKSMTYSEMVDLAEDVPPSSDGIIFFPHLMGERWPKFNSYAKGTIFGLTLSHRKKHIIRAILEGNAYLIRQIIESYGIQRIENITATGGGAKSKLWLQIISDVTGKTVSVPKVTEATALGSAILSAVGIGFFGSLSDAMKKWVHIHDCCFPDKNKKEIYDKAYELYCQIDGVLEEFYPKNLI